MSTADYARRLAEHEQAQAEHRLVCKDPNCAGLGLPPVFDEVEKPRHYNSHPSGVECIEIKRHLSSDVGDAFKYVFRADLKNGRQDLEKARYYLRDALTHGLAVFLPSWTFRTQQRLDVVIDAEPDYHRRLFYIALKRGNVKGMAWALTQLLGEEPADS